MIPLMNRRVPNDPPIKSDADDTVLTNDETAEKPDTTTVTSANETVTVNSPSHSNSNSSSYSSTPRTSPLSRSSSGRVGLKSSPTVKSPKSQSMKQTSPIGGSSTYISSNSNSNSNGKGSSNSFENSGNIDNSLHSDSGGRSGGNSANSGATGCDSPVVASASASTATGTTTTGAAVNSPSKKRSVDGGMKSDKNSSQHSPISEKAAAIDTSTSLILQVL